MRVPRDQLYKEVWAEPMTTVAKRYEVSSNYLARICERLNIPRPGRGYWQQRAVGVDIEPDPLPDVEPGDEIEWARDGSTPAIAPMSTKTPRRRSAAERPDKHQLLVGARGHFDEVRAGREVLYVLPRKKNLVDIFVTPATLSFSRTAVSASCSLPPDADTDANCQITKGGPLEEWLDWATAYAEKVDPLAKLRADLRRVVAEREPKASGEPAAADSTAARTAATSSPSASTSE